MVTRRLTPLVAALALAFAPIALDACQAVCALQTVATASAQATHHHPEPPTADDGAQAHSCHHLAVPRPAAGSTTMQGLPHRCAHVDDLPAAAAIALHANLVAPAVLPAIVFGAAPARDTVRPIESAPNGSPPRTANIAPLRV
jgi:hypothetical protein